MQNNTAYPENKISEKLSLSLYLLLLFSVLDIIYAIAYFAFKNLGYIAGIWGIIDHPYLVSLFCYVIAILIANRYVKSWIYDWSLFRLENWLNPKDQAKGYVFTIIVFAIINGICELVFKKTEIYFAGQVAAVLTTVIVILAAQWLKKPVSDPSFKTAEEKLDADKKWTVPYIMAVFLVLMLVCSTVLQLHYWALIIAVLLTYPIALLTYPLFKKTKKFRLNAKSVYPTGAPYQEMRHGANTDSVMPTGDMPPLTTETMHGKAAWMTDVDKNIHTAKNKENKPSYEGLWLGGGFFHHKEGNLISVAPPGTGKGAALIIPNLLWKRTYKHSFVVFDPKGTNACITARFRKEQGQKVIIIDPMGLQKLNRAKHGIAPSCFNPLDHIKHDIFNGASQIANLLLPDEPNAKDKYWNMDARNLIQAILLHIMTSDAYADKRNLITLHKKIIAADFVKLFNEMGENNEFNGLIADTAIGFFEMMKKSETMFSSLRAVASSSLKWLSNPALQAVLQKSDFSPSELENGNMTVYICQPISNKEGFATFSRLVTGFCLRANATPSNKPKAWVYYLLDEFPTMGNFPEVIEALAFSREYRMRIWIFTQSLSQLDKIYKAETRHEILGNATVFQAFSVTDHVTQEYISKRIGNQTVKYYKQSNSSNSTKSATTEYGGTGSSNETLGNGMSTSEDFKGKPLIAPDEIEQESNIITLTKLGPMRLVKWQYWEEAYAPLSDYYRNIFRDGRADPNPNMMSDDTDKTTDEKNQSGKDDGKTKYGPNNSFTWQYED